MEYDDLEELKKRLENISKPRFMVDVEKEPMEWTVQKIDLDELLDDSGCDQDGI